MEKLFKNIIGLGRWNVWWQGEGTVAELNMMVRKGLTGKVRLSKFLEEEEVVIRYQAK